MFTECSHSVKSSQILPSGDVALGKKWHTRQNSQNQNQLALDPAAGGHRTGRHARICPAGDLHNRRPWLPAVNEL